MLQIGNAVGLQGTAIAKDIEISIRDWIFPPYRQKTYFYKKKAVFLFGRAKHRESRFAQMSIVRLKKSTKKDHLEKRSLND